MRTAPPDILFGAAQIRLNRAKLGSMASHGFSLRNYSRMKTLLAKADTFLADSQTKAKLDKLSDSTDISLFGETAYSMTNSRPYLKAEISVVDPETKYKLSTKLKQHYAEPSTIFLNRVLMKARHWNKKLGLLKAEEAKTLAVKDQKALPPSATEEGYTFKKP